METNGAVEVITEKDLLEPMEKDMDSSVSTSQSATPETVREVLMDSSEAADPDPLPPPDFLRPETTSKSTTNEPLSTDRSNRKHRGAKGAGTKHSDDVLRAVADQLRRQEFFQHS